ncbi:MAG TPA: GNAT family N-acetyltransferase [Gaiellaceae bacterium]|nr:GNAT family N-acetyltransferase [Gaiellaceae bacterium]
MERPELSQLAIAPAETDVDLEALIAVRKIVTPRARPTVANLRHALESSTDGLTFIVGRLGDEPVACGFVEGPAADFAPADIAVVPDRRRMGIGSAVLAYVSERARALGKDVLQIQVVKSDESSRAFLERRGFQKAGGEEAVSLKLGGPQPPSAPPDGIRILSRRERPDVVEAMYEVYVECDQDVPGSSGPMTLEAWRAIDIDRPSRSPDLAFVALDGDQVVGYAVADLFGDQGRHGFTAVKRAWRRRGVATALKRAQIAAATELGLRRLATGSEERNLPMRTLNAKLGYQPDPELSVVVLRGPVQA